MTRKKTSRASRAPLNPFLPTLAVPPTFTPAQLERCAARKKKLAQLHQAAREKERGKA